MNAYDIPASITLAQGILESSMGDSRLALVANNHFGIKCHSDWVENVFTTMTMKKESVLEFTKILEPLYRDHHFFDQ